MPFEKGKSGNPKGKKPGKTSNDTKFIKKQVVELVGHGMGKAVQKLKEIDDPVKYMETISKFIQYVLPKNVDLTTKGEQIDQFKTMTTEELERRAEAMNKIKNE